MSRNDGLLSRSGDTSRTSTSSRCNLCEHLAPLVRVGRVDGDRANAGALGRGDLVAHESEQRRDQDGGPGTLPTQQQSGDEVHRGLAPPGALHDERPAVLIDERLDGFVLPVVKVCGIRADQGAQDLERGRTGFGYGLGHLSSMAGAPDIIRLPAESCGVQRWKHECEH